MIFLIAQDYGRVDPPTPRRRGASTNARWAAPSNATGEAMKSRITASESREPPNTDFAITSAGKRTAAKSRGS
jgi:hypothetical protein